MFKNVASQKLTVLAFADAGHATLDAGEPVTGDAAQITMKIEQDDDGTQSASNDVNPTEVEDGQYRFDLTQAETNGDKLTFYPESSTAGVQVVALPSNVIYTRPQYFSDLGIGSDGDLLEVNTLTGHTVQTGDSFARLGAPAGASVSADIAALPTQAEITGGAYALDTDANGRVRNVVGTGAGEISLTAGLIDGITGVKNTLDDLNDVSTAEVNTEADTALSDFFTSAAQLVDDIWDEVITGAQHNVNNSAARFLREASETTTGTTGTAQSATATTIQLASGAFPALADDDYFKGERVSIIEGTGAGQSRLITGGTASTDTVNVAQAWGITPSTDSVYAITGAEVEIRAVSGQTVAATAQVDFDDLAAALADTNELQGDWTNGGRLDLILDELTTQGDTNETAINALNDLSQADIRTAVGLASANLDTQLAALPTQAEITGGAYALDTDPNGRMRIVDGTGAGELDTASGLIAGIAGTKNTFDDLNDVTVANILTTQMTESYAANGVAPTLAQCQFAIHQMLMDFAISGTSFNVKQLGGASNAFVGTLDDASSPTSLLRT